MKIRISKTGQITFFPKKERDIFLLGKMETRLGKGESYSRWEYITDGKHYIVSPVGKVARTFSPDYNYKLCSVTIPSKILLQCIKTHILKEVE